MDDQGLIPGREREEILSLFTTTSIQGTGAHPTSYPVGTRGKAARV